MKTETDSICLEIFMLLEALKSVEAQVEELIEINKTLSDAASTEQLEIDNEKVSCAEENISMSSGLNKKSMERWN